MSILTLLTKKPPEIAGYTFDAVLEDELQFEAELPSYPVESGATIHDHRIIKPARYRIKVVLSNTPVSQSLLGFAGSMAGGLVSNLTSNPLVAAVAGMSAGFLASTSGTRASAGLEHLVAVLEGAEPFDIECGDISLKNMLITKITRARDPSNEGALVAMLEVSEFISLDRLKKDGGQPSHTELDSKDLSASALSSTVNKGVQTAKDLAGSALDKAKNAIGGLL